MVVKNVYGLPVIMMERDTIDVQKGNIDRAGLLFLHANHFNAKRTIHIFLALHFLFCETSLSHCIEKDISNDNN